MGILYRHSIGKLYKIPATHGLAPDSQPFTTMTLMFWTFVDLIGYTAATTLLLLSLSQHLRADSEVACLSQGIAAAPYVNQCCTGERPAQTDTFASCAFVLAVCVLALKGLRELMRVNIMNAHSTRQFIARSFDQLEKDMKDVYDSRLFMTLVEASARHLNYIITHSQDSVRSEVKTNYAVLFAQIVVYIASCVVFYHVGPEPSKTYECGASACRLTVADNETLVCSVGAESVDTWIYLVTATCIAALLFEWLWMMLQAITENIWIVDYCPKFTPVCGSDRDRTTFKLDLPRRAMASVVGRCNGNALLGQFRECVIIYCGCLNHRNLSTNQIKELSKILEDAHMTTSIIKYALRKKNTDGTEGTCTDTEAIIDGAVVVAMDGTGEVADEVNEAINDVDEKIADDVSKTETETLILPQELYDAIESWVTNYKQIHDGLTEPMSPNLSTIAYF